MVNIAISLSCACRLMNRRLAEAPIAGRHRNGQEVVPAGTIHSVGWPVTPEMMSKSLS